MNPYKRNAALAGESGAFDVHVAGHIVTHARLVPLQQSPSSLRIYSSDDCGMTWSGGESALVGALIAHADDCPGCKRGPRTEEQYMADAMEFGC